MTSSIPQSHRLAALFVAAAAIGVYVNSMANGFALDDVFIIQLNERAHDPLRWRDIWLTPYWPFQGRELGLYRPVTIFVFSLQWAAGGGAAWVFHAVSIMLHALATVLVFLLLSRLTGTTPAAVGALVFAVHPVHAEAVANVVGQAEIIAAILVLTACLVHMSRPSGAAVSWQRRLFLMCIFFLALATKESTVVLPALLVLCDVAGRRVRLSVRGSAEYADAMLMPLFLLAATLAAYLLLRFDVMGGSVIGVDAAPAMPYLKEEFRVLNALRAIPEFFRLLFFPHELAADYLPNILMPVEAVRPMVVLGAALLVLLTACALLTPWFPAAGFPAAWFVISMVTVSNLFFPIGVLVAERTLYLPSVALSALLAFAWHAGATRAPAYLRRAAVPVLAAALLLLGARTWIRNADWVDTDAVLNAFVRDHPHSYRAQWSQAALARARGHMDIADTHYQLAHRIYARDAQLLVEYAEFLLSRSDVAGAIALLEEAYALQPGSAQTVLLLAHANLASGRYMQALDVVAQAEEIGIHRSIASFIRAAANEGLGRTDDAIASWRVGIAHSDAASWRTWSFLARALAAAGDSTAAAAALTEARGRTSDPGALAVVERIELAIRRHCYADAAGTPDPDNCDPLGRWVGFAPPVHATPQPESGV